jgi:hypothetical protein
VYSVVEDAKEEDGIPTRSSAKIDGSKGARTMLANWVRSAGGRSVSRNVTRFSSTSNNCGVNMQMQ